MLMRLLHQLVKIAIQLVQLALVQLLIIVCHAIQADISNLHLKSVLLHAIQINMLMPLLHQLVKIVIQLALHVQEQLPVIV